MHPEALKSELKGAQEFFNRSTSCLVEADADFKPTPEAMTVAQQVAHTALTIDWFIDGVDSADGFDMNFEEHHKKVASVGSLGDAREWLAKAFERAMAWVGSKSPEELASPLPEGPVMGGAPRGAIIGALADHTAHHRGALTVYSRMRGHTPAMPYM